MTGVIARREGGEAGAGTDSGVPLEREGAEASKREGIEAGAEITKSTKHAAAATAGAVAAVVPFVVDIRLLHLPVIVTHGTSEAKCKEEGYRGGEGVAAGAAGVGRGGGQGVGSDLPPVLCRGHGRREMILSSVSVGGMARRKGWICVDLAVK